MEELFARDYSLIYTTDPNMASYKGEDKMPVQVSPSRYFNVQW